MQILEEAVNAANAVDASKDDLCPFCHEKPIGHATDTPEAVDDNVVSVPADLGCEIRRRKDGDLPYTTAQHHLISAMQCYARIRQLVRMGNMLGYNINCKENGIGLPTTHYTLTYPDGGGRKKYGDLDDPEGKKRIAFALMKELGAQWHVGHHAFTITVPKTNVDSWKDGGTDEQDENDYGHETQYDVEIISMLLALLKSFPPDFCEDEEKDAKIQKGHGRHERGNKRASRKV